MKLIVGLGNPGRIYEHTPHNIGFEVIDTLALRCDCVLRRSFRFPARLARTILEEQKALLVKPSTYMNRSGVVVAELVRKLGISPNDLLVILDDADLPLGRLRIRVGGGSGGHKGLSSILEHLGQDQFARLRLGIGRREGPAGPCDLPSPAVAGFAKAGAPCLQLGKLGQQASSAHLVAHVLTPFASELRPVASAMIERAADAVQCLIGHGAQAAMNKFNA